MIAIDPARLRSLTNQRDLAVGIACVMSFVAVVAIAAPPIAAHQREVRERVQATHSVELMAKGE